MAGIALLGGVLLAGCAGSQALAPVDDARTRTRHAPTGIVVAGDTLYSFAWRYGFDYRELARWNALQPPYSIQAGQRLRLLPAERAAVTRSAVAAAAPPANQPVPAARATAAVTVAPASAVEKPRTVAADTQGKSAAKRAKTSGSGSPRGWVWPVEGRVLKDFEPGKPGVTGIDIAAGKAQGIRAANDGKVVYRGSGLPGYGQLIIVKHSESLLSAYGYLGHIEVKEGQRVQRGQVIAGAGIGGGYREPVVHFEIRRDGKAVDPRGYLPG